MLSDKQIQSSREHIDAIEFKVVTFQTQVASLKQKQNQEFELARADSLNK
jgi:hypothetical protein